jgi:hypothetical protein
VADHKLLYGLQNLKYQQAGALFIFFSWEASAEINKKLLQASV